MCYDLANGNTVADVVKHVALQDEGLTRTLIDESRQKLRRLCRIMINGKLVSMEDEVHDEDSVIFGTVVTCDG
ncbi:hypothetical protein MCC01964_02260 [Bifidobacteriaceae bacterium MCC01964]|nr:hypothetical protein MCC01964_02260 [Bifidobacteriaceae bacterium MCC01964]